MDKRTGQVLWWAAPGGMPLDTTYSCPIVTVIGGERMLVAGNADGCAYGMRARTGETLWKFTLSKRGLNVSCVADGDYIYAAHSEENFDNTAMGRMVCIDARKRGDISESGEVWRFDGHTIGYASPAVANGRVYVIDNSANMFCLDAQTGREHWSHSLGRVGKGSPVVTQDGIIYAAEQNGVFHILKDQGPSVKELDKKEFSRDDGLVVEMFGSPAVANGRVYFQTRYHTYCLGAGNTEVVSNPIPPMAKESSPGASGSDHLQVVPAEITVEPGGQIQFAARHYASGIRQDDPQVTWSAKGIKGEIDGSGRFTAASDQAFSAGLVSASWQGSEATARVRIDPTVPILEDFEELALDQPPPGWIGVVGKAKVIDLDGNKVLLKMAAKEQPKPPFMRIRGYAMPPIGGGYTVQADISATEKKPIFKPDFGLINSRYRLFIRGMANSVRIDTWAAEPRIQEDVPFQFSPVMWYRMKFQVTEEGDHAMIRGKVWPKESAEPGEWTIEVKDTHPNREGSPGIYVYSVGTTAKSDGPLVYYDNLQVMRND
jgi:outer membrane protein assembly factor BamB